MATTTRTKKKSTRKTKRTTQIEGYEPTKVALAVACVGATALVLLSVVAVSPYL